MKFTKERASELGKKSSRKGVPNKSTKEIREALQYIVESKLESLSEWLDAIAAENPTKAFDIIIKLSEFIVPKLQRSEIEIEKNGKEEIDYSKLSDEALREITSQFNMD